MSVHLDETDFLVVDVETTGLSADGGDRVCELGAVKLRGGAVVDTFSSLINPQRPISNGAYQVNRISPEMVADAPTFAGIAPRLWTMMDDCTLVAYNARFDLSFLMMEFRLSGYPVIPNPVVDALPMARQLLPGLGRYPQENVAQVLGIASAVKHRALDDAMTTAKMFTIFTSILKGYDCNTTDHLIRRDLTFLLARKRLEVLASALDGKANVWLRYLSSTNFEITDRVVTPRELVAGKFSPTVEYLIAYCHTAGAERNFRIDRILDLRLVGPLIT